MGVWMILLMLKYVEYEGVSGLGNKNDFQFNHNEDDKRNNSENRPWMYVIIIIILIGLAICAYSIVRVNKLNKEQNNKNANISMSTSPAPTNSPTATITPTVIPATPTTAPTPIPTTTTAPTPTQSAISEDDSGTAEVDNSHMSNAIKGIYVPAKKTEPAELDKLISLAQNTEINAFVIDIKDDHGRITYSMNNDMVKQIGASTDTITNIKDLTSTLKSKKIYLIARIVAFKDPYLADKRHDLAIKNQDGTLYRDSNNECWVNPYNKEVWKYLVDIATQAKKDGFDEIQFDYIRFATGNEIKNANFGEEAKNKSKQEVITEFTKYAYEKLHPLGVAVSADVYGAIINSETDSRTVGQDYQSMARYLDYICPMIYPSHFSEGNYGIKYPDTEPYQLIYKVLMKSEDKLGQIPEGTHKAIVRPWLQDFTASWITHHLEYGGTEVRAQIKGVYDAGYGQWLLWNSGCNYSANGLSEN